MLVNSRPGLAAGALRLALAASFLSAVADRLGAWGPYGKASVSWGNFERFLSYTATLVWYMPAPAVAVLGWIATILEVVIALGLLSGLAPRAFATASGLLLLLFALAMTSANGAEPALSYSVWTASAASFLLASQPASMQPGLVREGGPTKLA